MNNHWKKFLNQLKNYSKKLQIPQNYNIKDLHRLSYIDKIIAANISIYVLYKLGIPSRHLYESLFTVRSNTRNPLNYFLANFMHKGIFDLALNCYMIKVFMSHANQYFGKKATLITFILGGALARFSANESIKLK